MPICPQAQNIPLPNLSHTSDMESKIWAFILFHTLGKFSRQQSEIFLIFPRKQSLTFHANCLLCIECQGLFLERKKAFQTLHDTHHCRVTKTCREDGCVDVVLNKLLATIRIWSRIMLEQSLKSYNSIKIWCTVTLKQYAMQHLIV